VLVTERWRFIDAGSMEAPVAFGRMPVVAGSVAQGGPQVLMTGLFGRSHFQIGWFEDVDAVLDLEAARALGVDVFRRPIWGGGTAFYDTGASAFHSYFIRDDAFSSLDEALAAFLPAMETALKEMQLGEAVIEGSSDIRWRGRKLGAFITQSILGTKMVGGFFNLKKPDMDLYRRVAHVPEEKFADKLIKDMVEYVCTPADVRGSDLEYEEFRDAILGAASSLGLPFDPLPFTAQEDEQTAGFVGAVSADDWVRRVSASRFQQGAPAGSRVGFANLKAKKLVRAGVALSDDDEVLAAMVAGDMHVSPPDAMDKVAAAIGGARAFDRGELLARIERAFADAGVTQADEAAGITVDDILEAVVLAAKAAGER
jgi:lipoate-protein ligase A